MINRTIFGVIHELSLLRETEKNIDANTSFLPKTVMLELPANYDQLVIEGKCRKGIFFDYFAEKYRSTGSKVIYGDRELIFPDKPLTLADALFPEFEYDSDERDKIMAENILNYMPNLVIVGAGHSEIIAPRFPLSYYYILFDHKVLGCSKLRRYNRAHQIIKLNSNI